MPVPACQWQWARCAHCGCKRPPPGLPPDGRNAESDEQVPPRGQPKCRCRSTVRALRSFSGGGSGGGRAPARLWRHRERARGRRGSQSASDAWPCCFPTVGMTQTPRGVQMWRVRSRAHRPPFAWVGRAPTCRASDRHGEISRCFARRAAIRADPDLLWKTPAAVLESTASRKGAGGTLCGWHFAAGRREPPGDTRFFAWI